MESGQEPPRLRRSLGVTDMTLLGLNGVIGAGIFLLPGQVTPRLGDLSWVAYVGCAGLCLLIGLCFAEMSSLHDETGGAFVYARASLGPFFGFLVGWIVWIAAVLGWASVAVGFVDVLGRSPALPGSLQGPGGRAVVLALLIGGLAAFNLLGARLGARANHVFALAKLVPLGLFVGLGALALLGGGAPSPATRPPHPTEAWSTALPAAVLYVLFAFSGFEEIPVPAGEVRDPRRAIPRALLAVLGITTLLYLGIQVVAQAFSPELARLPEDPHPLGSAAARFMGPDGVRLMTLGALVSLLGTNASVAFTAPRSMYALASQGFLPEMFARVHPRWGTPWTAIVATALLTLALPVADLVLGGQKVGPAWLPRFDLATLVRMSALASVMQYVPTCLAVVLRRVRPEATRAGFHLPGGVAIPVLALGVCGWLVVACPSGDRLWTLGGMALGIPVYAAMRACRKGCVTGGGT